MPHALVTGPELDPPNGFGHSMPLFRSYRIDLEDRPLDGPTVLSKRARSRPRQHPLLYFVRGRHIAAIHHISDHCVTTMVDRALPQRANRRRELLDEAPCGQRPILPCRWRQPQLRRDLRTRAAQLVALVAIAMRQEHRPPRQLRDCRHLTRLRA